MDGWYNGGWWEGYVHDTYDDCITVLFPGKARPPPFGLSGKCVPLSPCDANHEASLKDLRSSVTSDLVVWGANAEGVRLQNHHQRFIGCYEIPAMPA